MVEVQLEYKTDFAEVTRRWTEFWRAENAGPLVAATVPKPGTESVEKPAYGSGHDGNFEPVVEQLMRWADTHLFLGDAIPYYYLEFAADHFTTLLGVDLMFPDPAQGGWPVHRVTDWEHADIRFHREGKWWERTVGFAEALKKKTDGRIMIASPTLVSNLDALVALAGAEKVLLDLAERPDEIEQALMELRGAYADILAEFSRLFEYDRWGCINRHGMWCEGPINVVQSDFECMISPQMFEQFVYPSIKWEMEQLDHVEYHLDGPGAIKHAERICSIDKLDIMQWVPGAGAGEQQDWMWLYEKFDAWGKGQILGGRIEKVRELRRRLKSPKLFLHLHLPGDSPADHERLLEEARSPRL